MNIYNKPELTLTHLNFFPIFTLRKYVYRLTFNYYRNFLTITNQSTHNGPHDDLCNETWRLDSVTTKSFGSGKNHLFEV